MVLGEGFLVCLALLQGIGVKAAIDLETLCGSRQALGMQSRAIPDSAITASSSYDSALVGARFARIRTEEGGGAWCPRNQISNTSYEYLQIDLQRLTIIQMVETQGRFGKGQGREFATHYRLEYQKEDDSPWMRFMNKQKQEIIRGNSNTYLAELRLLEPPIIAKRIRFVPHSERPATVCMRVELYGCTYDGCGPVPEVPNSSNNATQLALYVEGTSVEYTCNFGYKIHSNNMYTCTNNQWTGCDVECEQITCGIPWVGQGYLQQVGDVTVGSTAIVVCIGYAVMTKGHSTIICREDGQWSDVHCGGCPSSDYPTFSFRNICYAFVDVEMNFEDASVYCNELNGSLVTIPDYETNLFLTNKLVELAWSAENTWIGAQWSNCQWAGENGPLAWSNSNNPVEPNCVNSEAMCGVIEANRHGKWGVVDCGHSMKQVICQI